MADPIEDAARPVVEPSASQVRCPLLVIAESTPGGSDQTSEPGQPPADPEAAPDPSAAASGGPSSAAASALGVDLAIPSTANRCAASVPPAVVSLGQQRLVCFDQGHLDCPQFVRAMGSPRGASGRSGRPLATVPVAVATVQAVAASPAGPKVEEPGSTAAGPVTDPNASPIVPVAPVVRSTRRSGARRARSRPRPIVVASGILVAALIVAFAFTSLRGGLALPSVGASPGAEAGRSPSGSAALTPAASPVASPSVVASVGPSPTPSPSPSPTPTPSPSPSPSPTAAASLPAAYVGLKPCPDAPDCYLYRIHPGDNLTAIAKRFGITITALKAANPEIKDPSLLHVGDKIRVPLPAS